MPNTGTGPVPAAAFTSSLSTYPATNQVYQWSPNCTLTSSASTSGTICSGSTLSLTGTILTGTATTFSWAGPAGYTSTLQSPAIANATTIRTGTYTFTATSAACSFTYTTTATVDSTPIATIAPNTSLCSGNSTNIIFTGTAGATISYNINSGTALSVVLNASGTASVSTGVLTTGTTASTYTYTLLSATLGSCSRTLSGTAMVVVNPLPGSITGTTLVCEGGYTTALASSPATGTWSSGASGTAAVNSATGLVTSGTAGTANITYTLPVTGCYATTAVTVNPTPPAISGLLQVCQGGGTTALANSMPGGTWSINPSSLAIVGASTGLVTGILPGSPIVTYTMGSSCYTTATVTVNPYLTAILGPGAVCENATIALTHPVTGGTWSATPATVGSIDPVTGVVTGISAGILTVSYLAPTNCMVTRNITVNPAPAPITGNPNPCLGYTTALSTATTTGAWSSAAPGTAGINASGVVTGAALGSTTISYTIGATGCYATVPSTVNPLPAPIAGATTTVCGGGAIINLTNATPGGTWSTTASSIAAANATTGDITGISAGTAPITYTISATGCYVATNVTVIPTPAPIAGPSGVCEAGSTISLTNSTTPGIWSISAGSAAAISSTGVVTGNTAGTATVTFTGGNNCFVTQPITVNPLPAPITGTLSVCELSVTNLSSTSTGGSWTTGAPFIAGVGTSGDVHGLLGGTAPITYTLPTGCRTSAVVTVNAIPATIGGNNFVCYGYTSVLTNSVAGGVWSSNNLPVATIDASGTMYGVTTGSATITYTTGTSGCFVTKNITVNPIVAAGMSIGVLPSTTVCEGTTVTFTANPVNGGSAPLLVWSINGVILSGASSYTYVPADGDIVRCWFVSSYDCARPDTASDVVTMTVHPIVTPGLSIATGTGDTVCTGALTTITATPVAGGTAPSYAWYVNMLSVGFGSSYTYTPVHGDIVMCTMSSNAFCRTATTASASHTLTVSNMLTPTVSMASSLGATTCDGYPAVYNASQVNGGTAPTYQWSVNGVNTVTGPVYSYAPANADDVAVTLTSNFPCLATPTATAHMAMAVLPITQPVGTISAQPGYIIPAGMNDTFTCTILSGGGIAPTYQWYKDNVPQAGATNSVFITNNLMNGDSVNCQVTNTDECSGVSVFSSLVIAIGNNVGVQHITASNNSFQLIPNPNNGSFTVKGTLGDKRDEELSFEITDMLGRNIHHSTTKAANGNINQQLSLDNALSNGVYLLNIHSATANNVLHFVIEK